ncbi:MlaD family protein [Conexibacter sp. SYSU D00693]|uniref:MlaD family protein n=1 Tax=Conexibacter sp. SYSU D00693 TaxID=2812560 RepID=UPI00196AE49A|nr:MlaD family protein [Conexibacter sp. SYSU D00693]
MTSPRLLAAALAAVTALVVAGVLLTGDAPYRVHLRFTNAGLLVEGGQVKVAGRDVGEVERIALTKDGLADVTVALDSGEVVPLRRDARATIRSLGAATITNRYVDLSPGSRSAPPLDDGATLPASQTGGIVDLDAFLDTFDAGTRADLQALLSTSAELYAGSGARSFNRMLERFAPAAREVAGVTGDLAADGAQLTRLIRTADVAATRIAGRRTDLEDAIDSSARWMAAVAGEREALATTLRQAPPSLAVGRRTLDHARTAVDRLRPSLRLVPDTAKALDRFAGDVRPALRQGAPVAEELRSQLPGVRRTLAGLEPLAERAVPALEQAGKGMEGLEPIFRGLRIYAPDFVLGIVNGLAGVAASNYTRLGHYARLEFIQNPQTTIGGAFAKLLNNGPLIPGITDVRTGLTRRCPGAAAPPAKDGSSPIEVQGLCDPAHSIPLLVNEPPRRRSGG